MIENYQRNFDNPPPSNQPQQSLNQIQQIPQTQYFGTNDKHRSPSPTRYQNQIQYIPQGSLGLNPIQNNQQPILQTVYSPPAPPATLNNPQIIQQIAPHPNSQFQSNSNAVNL